MSRWLLGLLLFFAIQSVFAKNNVVNIYAWAEEIPQKVIQQFEKETGIKVNYSTFESPEVMLAKLRTSNHAGYDVIEPGSLLVERMRKQGMLLKLDHTKLSNLKNTDPYFIDLEYDPGCQYSVPFFWGVTGIFINRDYYSKKDIQSWKDLFNEKYVNQLLLLDEARDVFAMALLTLGYSINDQNPEHIKEAYLKIKKLNPNIKLFNSDAVNSILIDEDATIGMAWNGDLYNAWKENPKLDFIFPQDGFEVWVDAFSILKNAPHRENAYKFLNFLLRPEIAKETTLTVSYSTTNLAAYNMLPNEIKNNPIVYPPKELLRKFGHLEIDVGDETSGLVEKYWELLKMGG